MGLTVSERMSEKNMTTATPTKPTVTQQYEAVIGLETHCQLSTETKIFCDSSAAFITEPNVNIDPICLGMPGVLPVLNQKVLEYAVKTGLALNCAIAPYSKFDRKQYFYPDLPKNYQITQADLPIGEHGWVEIELYDKKSGTATRKRIGVTRLHMEEDAGKLVHAGSDGLAGSSYSLVDYNRAGVPLVEIVSEPDIRTGQEAAEYAQEIRRIIRYLGVGNGNMQEGSLRCDVNISVRPVGTEKFGTKVEIKNMNSFSAIQKAIDHEIERQIAVLEAGGSLVQETRLWDEAKQETRQMRIKEGSSDYRYFPEPDLGPIELVDSQKTAWLDSLPELPRAKRHRYQDDLGLSPYDARVISDDRATAEYFETTIAAGAGTKLAANWVMGEIGAYLNANNSLSISDLKLTPSILAELIGLIEDGTISNKIAKDILPDLFASGGSPKQIIESKGLVQVSDPALIETAVDEVIAAFPNELAQYKSGKTKMLGFFVGQVLKKTGGKADPKLTNQIVAQKLNA
jgi:aspartyl-tRNA(Asn)/glutamyl-tRNA(Gln) amidotransferase subunit B